MKRRRKTKDERLAERYEAEQKVWAYFQPRLEACQSIADGIVLVNAAVAEGKPGRKFFSNLGFFLNTFAAPDGASVSELAAYVELIKRDPVLRDEQKTQIIERLRRGIAARP